MRLAFNSCDRFGNNGFSKKKKKMSTLKSECRKFSPNVFNKSKCQNCFRTKDTHSAEALENNRASRNVSKCGYLFVAPDWDFNVSVNRTKRWQRRWFVLYDDGELTYALDEFPDTIPQGTIDMNKVLDVSDAENVTGNDFAIAITTPEKVHFIKGTSKEESKWWFDVLSRVLPRHLTRGKHKRNATFPCGKATIPTTAVIAQEYCSEDDIRLNSYDRPNRPKFLSTSELLGREKEWMPSPDAEEDDVFPSNENDSDSVNRRDVEVQNALNALISQPDEILEESDGLPNHKEEKIQKDYLSQLEELDSRRRNRRYLKRENRIQRSQRSRVDGVSKMLPAKNRADKNSTNESSVPILNANGSAMAAAEKLEYLESINSNEEIHSIEHQHISPSEQGKFSSPEPGIQSSIKTNLRKSESLKNIPSESQSEIRDHVSGLRRYHSFKGSSTHRKIKPSNGMASLKKSKVHSSTLPRASSSTSITSSDVRINSDVSSSLSSDLSHELGNNGVFTRTGWLMRQTLSKDWSKHWFVLKDSSLTYYRDPSAEHCGIMDGILDLNQVSTIRETSSDRFYAFSLLMWDGKKHILATETDDFRSMWIQALQYASNLWSSASKEDFICSEIVLPEHSFHHTERSVDRISSPSSLSSLPYVYDNNLLEISTSSSDDQSEYFSLVDEDEVSELSSSPRTLPPSPPVNRNMMSLVKEKSRIRSNANPKTPPAGSGLNFSMEDNDHDAGRSNHRYQDDDRTVGYKDTHSSLQDRKIDTAEVPHNLINGGRISSRKIKSSSTSSHLPEDSDNLQFRMELRNQLPKDDTNSREMEFRNSDSFLTSEFSNTSTPKSESVDECRMCVNMKYKLVAAKEEIRKLKKELKEAYASFDNLEMASYKLTQDIKMKEENYNSQISLMTAKIDDLTSKFSIAEKNYRQLKQKAMKSEGKERKRSSLKNREGLSLTKEYELKLCDLEKKISNIEASLQTDSPEPMEDSEPRQIMMHTKLDENGILPSESSDTSTSTDFSSSSNKGFFSRLQSLGSKVQNVNSLLEKDKSFIHSENPKICLQDRENEVSSRLDDCDDWWTVSFNNSLKVLNKYLDEHPSNLSDCQSICVKKIGEILRWLKNSLEYISKQENKINNLTNEKVLLIRNLVDLIDPSFFDAPKETHQITQTNACRRILLAYEVMKSLERIESADNIETLVKFDVTECAFKVIVKTLCVALAEYENPKLTDSLQLISSFPQVRFFCPIINKLFPPNPDEVQQFLPISELLKKLDSEKYAILGALQEAKDIRYESLWNTLTEVPVQDANTKKPRPINSVLNFVTSVATNIHRIAELHLSALHYQSSYILKIEHDKIHEWCIRTNTALKNNLTAFLNELREKCPMIHESTVSLSDLNDTTLKEITCCLSELSCLSIAYSVLNSLLAQSIIIDKPLETEHTSQPFSNEEWTDRLKNMVGNKLNFVPNADLFECPQCTILNNFLSDSSQELNWTDYVWQYNLHKSLQNEQCDFAMENLKNAVSTTCADCDNNPPESVSNRMNDMCNSLTCTECENWIKKFCASEREHELERQSLELTHSQELQQLEECLIKSSEVHEQEMLQKENELAMTTTQLQCLKTEYETQIQALKNLYEQKLHFDCETVDENSIRQMYKAEIEDLKDMFKKGLKAIENSHHRITTEIEKRHKDEIAALKAEKERALELEAQATKTALEAIRKTHEEKLKEETEIIKQDLTRKFQNSEQCEAFFCKYGNSLSENALKEEESSESRNSGAQKKENAKKDSLQYIEKLLRDLHMNNEPFNVKKRNDLEKLKTEILNITDMYSAKCLENVALEEKVDSLRHQLEEAHNELCDLLTKNKEIDPNSTNI